MIRESVRQPETSLGYIHHSKYIPHLYSDEGNLGSLTTTNLIIKSQDSKSSSIIISSDEDSIIWRIVVNELNGSLSFDNEYVRNTITDIITSTPRISFFDSGINETSIRTNITMEGSFIFHNSPSIDSTTSGITYTGTQIRSGLIIRNGILSASSEDKFPIASDIFNISLYPNQKINDTITFSIKNASTQTISLSDSNDLTTTLSSDILGIILNNAVHKYIAKIISITPLRVVIFSV